MAVSFTVFTKFVFISLTTLSVAVSVILVAIAFAFLFALYIISGFLGDVVVKLTNPSVKLLDISINA